MFLLGSILSEWSGYHSMKSILTTPPRVFRRGFDIFFEASAIVPTKAASLCGSKSKRPPIPDHFGRFGNRRRAKESKGCFVQMEAQVDPRLENYF